MHVEWVRDAHMAPRVPITKAALSRARMRCGVFIRSSSFL